MEPKLVSATPPSNLQTDGHSDRAPPVGPERASSLIPTPPEPSSTSESPGAPKTFRNAPPLQTTVGMDIPEPLGTEIILSTQQDLPARRKNPPSKAIQIIDPRPLPSKKTHTNLPEFPTAHISPHLYLSIASDHDYCGPADRSLTSAAQRSRASKVTDELQVTTHESSAAAPECRRQTSTGDVNVTVSAVNNKAVMQHLSEEPRTTSETNPSTDKVPSPSDSGCAAEDKTAPCTLPTPPPSPPARGREKRRYRRRSPRSDSSSCSSSSSASSSSSSSSASRSPKRQK